MNMLHWQSPWETETGSAGGQPVKGYCGQAHQTMGGRGVQLASRPTPKNSSDDRPVMPQKTQKSHAQTCVQGTGRATAFFPTPPNEIQIF